MTHDPTATPPTASPPAAKLRLVFLARSLDYGGAERQLVALARGLHRRDHRVVVALLYPDGPLAQDLLDAGVPIVDLGKHGRWAMLGFSLRLARFLLHERPHIVHGYLEFQNVLALVTKPLHRGRAVWGIRASDRPLARYDRLTQRVNRLERALSRFPDLIIANSHAGRAHHLAVGFPADRLLVVPNGIDTDRFRPDDRARQRIRTELAIRPDQVLVGLVARLDPMKDHHTFLTAAALLARDRSAVRFVCVGQGSPSYAAELAAAGDRLGLASRLIWTGPRGDMPAVFNSLDIAVSSSSSGEGFPNTIGEAMACGIPCVVTDVGDSAIIVGDRGEVVPPHDPPALAAAIARLLDQRRHGTLGPASVRDRVVANFSLPCLIERTEAILHSLVAGARQ